MPNALNGYDNRFFAKSKYKSGRSKFGELLVYSKGPKKSNYYLFYDQKRIWSRQLATLLNYNFLHANKLLGLIKYVNGSLSLVKLAHGQMVGCIIRSIIYPVRICTSSLLGYRSFLSLLRKGFIVFDITVHVNTLPQFAKASGTYCHIFALDEDLGLALLKLPSSHKKYFSINCLGTLGRNSNIFAKFKVQGNVGFNYIKGKKPIVRGVAMNPVDHPHGGRTKTNRPEVSPWGWVAKHSH